MNWTFQVSLGSHFAVAKWILILESWYLTSCDKMIFCWYDQGKSDEPCNSFEPILSVRMALTCKFNPNVAPYAIIHPSECGSLLGMFANNCVNHNVVVWYI